MMEIIGGILASILALVLLAGVGLMTVVALATMLLLGLVTEMSFKRVFVVSFVVGLLAPILLGAGLSSAIADGSLQEEIRSEFGEVVQLPEGIGNKWVEVLPQLQEISREREAGNMTDEEAEQRIEAIFREFEGLQISINGDDGPAGVPLELPETVEEGAVPSDQTE
ncbi:hypothetical protein [Qipengyuania sp. DGS5-3]|uniref:hypothetical protein n=1 Tax=Qipengyuania sp. DGS5-3 TaxID=3349632 RepID=UPI0036D22978